MSKQLEMIEEAQIYLFAQKGATVTAMALVDKFDITAEQAMEVTELADYLLQLAEEEDSM
jgi:hypothetical protein